MKRLGLLALLFCLGVISIEGLLAILRQRTIILAFRTEGSQPTVVVATPQPGAPTITPSPEGAQPDDTNSGSILIATDGAVIIDVHWEYRIGPRFPVTIVQAQVHNTSGDIVAADKYTITCGSDTMACTGERALTLRFGVRESTGTQATWPVGSYTLTVTRTFAGANTETLTERPLIVAE